MSNVMIRIGASLDRSTSTVFQQIADSATRANRRIADEARRAAKEEDRAWKDAQREMARWERERVAAKKREARETEASARTAARAEERIAREKVQAMMRVDREMTRFAEQQSRARARAEEQAANDAARAWVRSEERRRRALGQQRAAHASTVDALGGLVGRGLYGAGMRAVGFGGQLLGDIAAGAGVRLDAGSHFAAASDLEARAIQLSNSAYMPGQAGANGMRQDPRDLMREAYGIGTSTGTAANEVMGGMQQFVGKTGDLETARAVMGDLARLSKATGANLDNMADAAADVSNQLGDVPDKAGAVKDVMLAIAGQGKLGAVEVKDLAAQMAKVAASAQLMEGKSSSNIKLFGAIAQEARAHGGAASATQAATSVASMMDTFSKGARLDAFHKAGVRTASLTEPGKLRNIEEIIIESLQKSQKGGNADLTNQIFGSMFATAQSRRAVRGYESIFRSTYGGATGTNEERLAAATKAVREEFDRMQKVAMSENELRESFAKSMESGQSKAEAFNNQLQMIAHDAQDKLMPALVALAPAFLSATKAVADFAVNVLGLAPKPGEALAGQNAAAAGDIANVQNVIKNKKPGDISEDEFQQMKQTLLARRATVAKEQKEAAAKVKDASAMQGNVYGNAAHELYGGLGKDLVAGNYGKLALSATLPGMLLRGGSAIYHSMKGDTTRQTETANNVSSAIQEQGKADAVADQLDKQIKALDDMHKTLRGGVIKVEVVKVTAPGGVPGGAGGGTNRGLEPTG